MMTVKPVTLQGRHLRLDPMSTAHAEGLYAIGQHQEDWVVEKTGQVLYSN